MIHHGDCLEILKTLPDCSIHSLVTDPPAGISFMNLAFDSDRGGRTQWIAWMKEIMQECLRVMKPGAHGLVWALPRTSHWTATALEDAGFEVRDIVNHIFGSGFPKSHNVSKAIDKMQGAEREVVGPNKFSHLNGKENKVFYGKASRPDETISHTPEAKQWDGWGTALKPAVEHWILIRKPLEESTIAENVLKHGTGGLNIDQSRIQSSDQDQLAKNWDRETNTDLRSGNYGKGKASGIVFTAQAPSGRFPANLLLSHNEDCEDSCTEGCPVADLDRQSGVLKTHGGGFGDYFGSKMFSGGRVNFKNQPKDRGGASRFFYCSKASKRDKGELNTHPTIKNTKLMSYLINLITPPNGVVLDPFAGSGSTLVAAQRDGFQFIGIEKELEYFNIMKARIENCDQNQLKLK